MTDENSPFSGIKIWIMEFRIQFFTCSVLPVLLGVMVALNRTGVLRMELLSLTLIGIIAIHAASNMIDDYFDYVSGADEHPIYERLDSPFFGGSGMISEGKLGPEEVRRASVVLFAFGSVIGVYLALARGWEILALGITGILFGYFHAKHISTRGLGEFSMFLNFGPLIALGSYYVQSGEFAIGPIVASLPIGIAMFCMLLVNSIPDYEADNSAGKETIPVKIGRKKSAYLYIAMILVVYLSVIFGFLLEYLPSGALLVLVTLPLSAASAKVVIENYDSPREVLPANLYTYLLHFSIGVLLITGYILSHFYGSFI